MKRKHGFLWKPFKLLVSLFLFTIISFTTSAQRTVSGTVKDAQGNPVAAATVEVKGTNVRTQSGNNGTFSINVPAGNNTLVISSIGYGTVEVDAGAASSIVLTQTASNLNEVVVVGYGTQRKQDLAGAVSVVDVSEMKKQPGSSAVQQLQGRAAGVTITGSGEPGEPPLVKIRGINSFGNNTPLYVVDGVPTQNIAFINPADISSMQVLKDAGSASIYGSRASNGVVIITTKRGTGKVKVTYDGYYGSQMPRKGNVWDILSPQEMANLKWLALKNTAERTGTPFIPNDELYGKGTSPVIPDYILPFGASEGSPSVSPDLYYVNPEYKNSQDYEKFYRITKANKQGTNWFEEITRNAPINNHNVTMSSGNENGNFLLGLNYFNQQGTIAYTYMKRYSVRFNSQFNLSPKIRIGENLMYSLSDNPRMGINSEGNYLAMAFRQQPIIPVYDIMGNFAGTSGGKLGNATNPVASQYRSRNNRGTGDNLFGNVFGEVDLLKGLLFRTSFGGERYSYEGNSFGYPTYENAEDGKANTYNLWTGSGFNWTWSNTLTYEKVFNIHRIKLMGGTEAWESKGRESGGSTQGYFSFDPNFTTLSTGSANPTNYSGQWQEGIVSYFGRLDYSFNDKYIISGTVRRDGSSKLLNYRWGTFPAVSAAWRISEEPFMKENGLFSDLKLRGSWGIRGNQFNVSADNAFATFVGARNSTYYDITGSSNSIVEGFRQARIANADAKWEKDVDANIGVDGTIRNGVLDFSIEYYRKDISDLLFTPTLPGTVGQASAPATNIGSVKNEGWDLQLGSHPKIGGITLNLDATFTTYKNEIVKIAPPQTYFDERGVRTGNVIRNMVGQPMSTFFGYKVIGFWDSQQEIDEANSLAQKATGKSDAIFQTDAAVGRFRYDDKGAGIVTADSRQVIGNPNPDFTYGLNIGFDYKGFDFSTFFYGVAGADIYNQVRWWTDFYPSFAGAKSKTALYNSWTPENKNAKVTIQENNSSFSSGNVVNSYFVENGSYLRNKNVTIGYTLPNSIFNSAIEKMRVYLQATNLFTITKYTGLDPEVSGWSSAFGVDEGMYPNPKQFIIGANVTF